MDIKEMLTLRQLLEEIAGMAESGRSLTKEERTALHHFNEEADQGEAHRLRLLRLARLAGIEPVAATISEKAGGLGVTAIE